ncbi:hypothetical protein [Oceanicoccus sp. KOV_DT_Chl]|uniref:hypothetical protein n=1 Tax=Oceanicoccus sp. KOV_DT_Chl TaxID=1904639 RepID=UPI000C7D7E10|nr:hypothetical protein [Oceanicoccus sp. KOV_DT_Chl]
MVETTKDWRQMLTEWQQKVDALTQRERILLFATAVVVVFMGLQILLLDPVMKDRKQLQNDIRNFQQQIQLQSSEQQILEAQLAVGVDRNKIKQRDQLQIEINKLNAQIQESVVAMIPPKLMPEVLEQLLTESKSLKLLSLENKPVVAVLNQPVGEKNSQQDNAVGATKTNQQALYNHSFVLQLSGNYKDAIRYFERLSQLPWRFHWDNLSYKVESYPNAIITLEVHTVSMAEEWIGV